MESYYTTLVGIGSCPCCGYKSDTALLISCEQQQEPSPGAYAVCVGCPNVLKYTADCAWVFANNAELVVLTEELLVPIINTQNQLKLGRENSTLVPQDNLLGSTIDGKPVVSGEVVDITRLPEPLKTDILGDPVVDALKKRNAVEANGIYSVSEGKWSDDTSDPTN